MASYLKHVYWLDPDEFVQWHARLSAQGREPKRAAKAMCLPLSPRVEVGYVPADGWEDYGLCRRQGSWYKASPLAGKTLLVSNRPIEGLRPDWIIRRVKFKPPKLPNAQDMAEMVARDSYANLRPEAWQNPAPEERAQTTRWQKVMGLGHKPFEELFLGHCANHANFIEPLYSVEQDGIRAPYSIARTKEVCSACLELYGIVGAQHDRMLVTPCPGAAAFASMAVNRYYEVSKG